MVRSIGKQSGESVQIVGIMVSCTSYHYRTLRCRYSVPGREKEYIHEHVGLYVDRSVCVSVREHISETIRNIKSSVHVSVAVARCSSGSVAISYELPVFWITSCLHIMVRNRLCKKGVC